MKDRNAVVFYKIGEIHLGILLICYTYNLGTSLFIKDGDQLDKN